MKSIVIAGLLAGAAHGSAVSAGPYANIENNAVWLGGNNESALTEVHAGYEFNSGIYVQGGPAFVSVDGEELVTEYSGKIGISGDVSENLEVYGEVAFVTEDQTFDTEELNLGTKLGVTYRF